MRWMLSSRFSNTLSSNIRKITINTTLTGYADLVRALKYQDDTLFDAVTESLCFEKKTEPQSRNQQDHNDEASGNITPDITQTDSDTPLKPTPFWRITDYHPVEQTGQVKKPTKPVNKKLELTAKPGEFPVKSDLITPAQLSRKLRNYATALAATRWVDSERLVDRLSKAQSLSALPMQQRKRWGSVLHIICDHSIRLTPYWSDQIAIMNQLQHWFPKTGIDYGFTIDGSQYPLTTNVNAEPVKWQMPPGGSLVIVIGDLGCLDRNASQVCRFWRQLGQAITASGSRPVALVPGSTHYWNNENTRELNKIWQIIALEDANQDDDSSSDLQQSIERVLTLCAFATRLQPGYLRAVRKLIGADAAVESLVWQHPALTSPNVHGAPLDVQVLRHYQQHWPQTQELMEGIWQRALQLQNQWRNGYSQELWFAEILAMPEVVQQVDMIHEDLDAARALIEQIDALTDTALQMPGLSQWVEWFLPISRDDPNLNAAVTSLYEKFGEHNKQLLPEGYSPHLAKGRQHPIPFDIVISQHNGELRFATPQVEQTQDSQGSLIGQLRTGNGQIKVQCFGHNEQVAGLIKQGPSRSRINTSQLVDITTDSGNQTIDWPQARRFTIESDDATIDLNKLTKPQWANAIGRDQYGLWASFHIESASGVIVTQRMRWIAPGRFILGSPDNEPGRYDDEGPQHQVTLTQGYWLFDTPVTQALYEAVTGQNPSQYQSAQRPVDSVSWDDAMQFIEAINKQYPDLHLSLPSEAQWEYACRAGTTTATYAGAIEILGENNAPVLDAIAWYGGNSGKDFDLDEGYDSSGWSEKQYPHTKSGTRIVAQKHPNPWGFYDILGNVFEWCLDGQREYTEEPRTDPLGSTEDGTDRVLRGGSWHAAARYVRCAYRVADPPDHSDDGTGFRCARVQEPGQVS